MNERDRSFHGAAADTVARAAEARRVSTDPNWPPDQQHDGIPREATDEEVSARHAAPRWDYGPTWPVLWFISATDTTIDPPPTADALTPAQRAKLEAALLDMDCARERIRKMLDQT